MNIELQVKNLFANASQLDEAGFIADFYYIAKEFARQQNGAKPLVSRSFLAEVRQAVADYIGTEGCKPCNHCICELPVSPDLTYELIIEKGLEFFGITRQEITSKSRKRTLVDARHILIWLIKDKSDLTLSAMGRLFKRNHTTIIFSVKKINNLLETNPGIQEKISKFKQFLNQ
jgi:hypothetical protein